MRLTDLEPQFLKREDNRTMHYVDTLAEAQGISFLCPQCFKNNNGPVGTHTIICWFTDRGVPDNETPGPGRWSPSGTSYADLSFVGPQSASILIQGGCNAHFFIRNGAIEGA